MTKFRARNNNVIVMPDDAEKMKGSIIIPEQYVKLPSRGTVLNVGPGYVKDNGERMPLDIKEGERVEFRVDMGQPILELDGEPAFLLRDDQVIAWVDDEPLPEMTLPKADGEADDEDTDEAKEDDTEAEASTPAAGRLVIASR